MRKLLFLSFVIIGSFSLLSCGSTDSTTNYQISISASPSEGGTVSPSSGQYEEGTSLDISATPSEDYRFVEWQGGYEGTSSSATITVDSEKNIQAIFAKKEYALTVNTEGEGTVDESVVQTTSTTDYESGTIVELTANPAEGWKFVEWQGDVTSTENPTQITVDEAKEVTAVFEKKNFAVKINVEGKGSVTISPDQEEYTFGTEIELTVNPDENWEFSEWSGDISETENPLTLTVNGAMTVTAIFSNTTFAGGNGTEVNPYKVSTLEQLQAMRDYPDNHYIQVNDIDASDTKDWNGGTGFQPIGDDIIPFTGTYDGQNYKISKIYIKRDDGPIGLFGYAVKATFKNLKVVDLNIEGQDVGGIVGQCVNGCKLKNLFSSGNIRGTRSAGGIFGNLSINSSYDRILVNEAIGLASDAAVKGNNSAGGLGSYLSHSNLKSSKFNNQVISNGSAGGLVAGLAGDVLIKNSSSNGKVKGKNESVGGITGNTFPVHDSEPPKLEDVNFTGEIEGGPQFVGGLIGKALYVEIQNSYSNSSINLKKSTSVGGLVGWMRRGIINESHSTGNIKAKDGVGGLVGLTNPINNDVVIRNSYSEAKITGQDHVGGLVGNHFNGGFGQTQIVASHFKGEVVGHDNIGGLAGSISLIKSSFAECDVSGDKIVGGLSGSTGTIEKSYFIGTVSGKENVGGLSGYASVINRSHSSGNIMGENIVGGLVSSVEGGSEPMIIQSYSKAKVVGNSDVGGLVGLLRSNAKVQSSFAIGQTTGSSNVGGLVGINGGSLESTYWDTKSTNQSDGIGRGSDDGATGLTTTEMTGDAAKANMTEFDFTEIWVTTDSYPILQWQNNR